jgi:hypothetical protein
VICSGSFVSSMTTRDYTRERKNMINKVIVNLDAIDDQTNVFGRGNPYTRSYFTNTTTGAEPSISCKMLMIPLNTSFSLHTRLKSE